MININGSSTKLINIQNSYSMLLSEELYCPELLSHNRYRSQYDKYKTFFINFVTANFDILTTTNYVPFPVHVNKFFYSKTFTTSSSPLS